MKTFLDKLSRQNYITPILLIGTYGAAFILFQMELMSLNTEVSPMYASLQKTILSVSYSISFIMSYVIWLLLGIVFSFSAIIFGATSFNLSKILKLSSLSYVASAILIITAIFIFGKDNIEYLIQSTNVASIILYLGYIGVIKATCSISIFRSILTIITPLILIVAITYLFKILT